MCFYFITILYTLCIFNNQIFKLTVTNCKTWLLGVDNSFMLHILIKDIDVKNLFFSTIAFYYNCILR